MVALMKGKTKTTCGQMQLMLYGCLIISVFFAAVSITTWYRENHAVKTVVVDTVPSIIAAERIRATLADANANAINAALIDEKDGGKYSKTFREEMNTVHKDLVTATSNITYGDEERKPITDMMMDLGTYERVLGKTQDRSVASAMPNYIEANRLMRDKLLKSGAALADANYTHMTSVYVNHKNHVLYEGIAFLVAGAIMVAMLLYTQVVLYHKTHRRFNIGFLVATVASVLLLAYVSLTMVSSESHLKLVKEDAFDSVNALWKAKAIAYDANNDESLYLLYHGIKSQQDYVDQTAKYKFRLLSVGDSASITRDMATGTKIKGLLGDEMANVTFKGEREAATATMKAWVKYTAIDANIRKLEQAGNYKEALALNIGTKPGESNYAFDQFDAALTKTLDINTEALKDSGNAVLGQLKYVPYVIGIVWLIVFLSCIFGMKPRIEEYN